MDKLVTLRIIVDEWPGGNWTPCNVTIVDSCIGAKVVCGDVDDIISVEDAYQCECGWVGIKNELYGQHKKYFGVAVAGACPSCRKIFDLIISD